MGARQVAIKATLVSAVSIYGLLGAAAQAQNTGIEDIIVTAQRQAQSLQDVPIAVSAFSAESLSEKQINNAQQLQLTLPNVTFAPGNFGGGSFTIRGIGDLCIGTTCDRATAIHMNDLPLFGTRIFETEYLDLERVEVLRGPQGTLFGRNASAGVVNFASARPDLSELKGSVEGSYGNYDEMRFQGMLNVPITERFGARVAGLYMKRDGYTENLWDNSRLDGRDMFAVRGSLRWEPTEDTQVDLMGYWFREDDDRVRIQKQMCTRDPTGILGCNPFSRGSDFTHGNSLFSSVLSSKELLMIQGGAAMGETLSSLALGSLYGTDLYANISNPSDPRQIYSDFKPTYFAEEIQAQARLSHDFGGIKARVSAGYNMNRTDSSQDYVFAVPDGDLFRPGLNNLAALGAMFPQLQAVYDAVTDGSNFCSSLPQTNGTGVFSGNRFCSATPQDFDRSYVKVEGYTLEGILSTDWTSPVNFLVGGIYNDVRTRNSDYYVSGFPMDYMMGVLGALQSIANPDLGNVFMASPFFYSNTDSVNLKSWGLFGEAYWDVSDRLRLTAGIRYNNDKKSVKARSMLASFLAPYGIDDIYNSPYLGSFDADPGIPGNQPWQERTVKFSEMTGRFVADFKITDDNLLYASYSRGYKSGGINPPMQPELEVQEAFNPEFIDAFEIGIKNRFADGALQLNATAFYYKYKDLQLARTISRTAINDNVDANIWGVEVEGIIRPIDPLLVNVGFSYLNTKVSDDMFIPDTFDPTGGRSDAVVIKDITNGANCAVVAQGAANAALANGYVAAVNAAMGLQAPVAFPEAAGLNGATGAFGICSVLEASAAASGVDVISSGIPINIKGAKLPQAPEFKASIGVQWTQDFDNGMTLVPRVDMAFTGDSYGSVFNNARTRIESYTVVNAQIQLNGPQERWFLRGYVQNLGNNNAVVGTHSGDQSGGNFTNVFTLEPRRYGVTAGFKF